MLDKILGARQTPTDRPAQSWFLPMGSSAGIHIDEDTALTYSAVFSAVKVISETIAILPWRVFRETANRRDLQPESQLDTILHRRPNPEMTAFQFREFLWACALLWGNGYAEIERNRMGEVVNLWPIHPKRVEPERADDGSLIYRVRSDTGEQTDIPARQMFHLRGPTKDGITGRSMISLARESWGLGIAQEQFASGFFGNGGTPSLVIQQGESAPDLSQEGAANMLESFDRRHKGTKNAGKTAYLERGFEVKTVGVPQKDAQFIEGRKFQTSEVARWFRLPPHKIGDMEAATYCLPAGTPVFTEFGPKPIESVSVNERVWSYDGGGMVLSPVKAAACSGSDGILKISARGSTLRCNRGHRVLVRRQTLVPFNGGRGQCVVQDGRKWRREWQEMYVRADEVQLDDYLVAPSGVPIEGKAECPTRREVSEQFCEILGHHLGDGFMFSSRGELAGFGFSHGADETTRDHYAAIIESEFSQREDYYNRDSVMTAPVVTKRRDDNTTVVYHSAAAREIVKCGVGGTAHSKRVPEWAFRLPYEHRVAFIRGYLDSDGHVNKNGQARLYSVNSALIEDFRHLAISCGFAAGRVGKTTTGNTFGLRDHTCYSFTINSPEDVIEIGSHKVWYRVRAKSAVDARRSRSAKVHPYEARRRGLDNDAVRYMKVVSIEPDGYEPVYDLSVADTQSFVANGVIVHNSNIEQQAIDFVVDSILPWTERGEQEANAKLINRSGFVTKMNVNGLLRGDSAARAEFYTKMRDLGAMSINEIRSLEDMNPLDENGDLRLVPLNMVSVDRAAQEGATQQSDPTTAMRGVLVDAHERMLAKEQRAAERAYKQDKDMTEWAQDFYQRHAQQMRDALMPGAEALAEVVGTQAARHIDAHVEQRVETAKRDIVNGTFEHWEDQAGALTDQLIERIVRSQA